MSIDLPEADLLSFVEGELTEAEARRVEHALGADPAWRLQIERMKQDRQSLLDLEAPVPPRDLVAGLEPMLARPLLVPHDDGFRPGVLRRQRRRQARRRVIRNVALAAGWLLAVTAALWATVVVVRTGSDWLGGLPQDVVVVPPSADGRVNGADSVPVRVVIDLDSGPIHHHWRVAQVPGRTPRVVDAPAVLLPPEPYATGFALAVGGGSIAEVEQALSSALEPSPVSTALVRNLTYGEARDIEQALLAEMARQSPGTAPDAIAGTSGPRRKGAEHFGALARRVSPRLRDQPAASRSGVVSGEKSLMPPYEQQLEFAEVGATYTIALPSSAFDEFLERVHLDVDAAAVLSLLRAGSGDSAGIMDRPAILRELDEIEAAPGRIVWLPVVVRAN